MIFEFSAPNARINQNGISKQQSKAKTDCERESLT